MTRIDPEFAITPAAPGYFGSAREILDDIASAEEDVACWEGWVRDLERDIPRMQIELLTYQRDIPIAKLKIIDLRAKLAAKTGGR
jgi:hypothetical protein